MTTPAAEQLTVFLTELTIILKKLNLWQDQAPSSADLASSAPFCCDTLSFEQWLQFVLIKRLNNMIDTKMPLPDIICLCPMAEQAFSSLGQVADKLINVIGDIDELLSGERQQTLFLRRR